MIPSEFEVLEFEALELSSVTTSSNRALHFSKVLAEADAVFSTFAILVCSLGKLGARALGSSLKFDVNSEL